MNPITAIKEALEWKRAGVESVGYGLPGICPKCNSQGYLQDGWYNQHYGKARFFCATCRKSWSWSRYAGGKRVAK